ncbi:MAG TPA: hypothetical protein VMV18_10095 [bacterium]|nr:hypothetical protein [bacterium]
MEGSRLRKILWIVVWAVSIAVVATGVPLLAFLAPKITVIAGRFALDPQLTSRAGGAASFFRGLHVLAAPMLVGGSVVAVALSLSRSRWKSRVVTIGPAAVGAVCVAWVTGRFLSTPEFLEPVVEGPPQTRFGAVPLTLYLAHVVGGLSAALGVLGVWTISHRAGRGDAPE